MIDGFFNRKTISVISKLMKFKLSFLCFSLFLLCHIRAFELEENTDPDIQVLPLGSNLPSKNQSFQALPLDPAVYYGRLQNKAKKAKGKSRKKNPNRKKVLDIQGSFSGGGHDAGQKSNTLKYAFLQPQTPPDGGQVSIFYQHFMSSFFVRKCFAQLLCAYSLGL